MARGGVATLAVSALLFVGVFPASMPAEGAPGAGAAVSAQLVLPVTETSGFTPVSPDSSGITYLPNRDHLLISDSEVNEMPIFANVNLWELTLSRGQEDTGVTLPLSDEPTGLSYNPNNHHLYVSDDTGTRSVYDIDPGADGRYGTGDDIGVRLRTSPLGSSDPEGVAYDPVSGNIFIVDGVGDEVYQVDPGPDGLFNDVGDTLVGSFDVEVHGAIDPEGIAHNPFDDTLLVLDRKSHMVYEVTKSGTLIRTIDVEAADAKKEAGIVLAPASNGSAAWNMYIVARGTDNDSNPNENDGRLYEMSVDFGSAGSAPVAVDDSASTGQGSPVIVNVAGNDGDVDGNLVPGSAAPTTGPSSGAAVGNANGTITYTPTPGFVGTDDFDYEICDTTALCDTATVTVTVSSGNVAPVAVDDGAVTAEGVAVTIDVAANDDDVDGELDLGSVTTGCGACVVPAHGGLVNHGDGTFVYTPAVGFSGTDGFVYEICDTEGACDTATVTITVSSATGEVAFVPVADARVLEDAPDTNYGGISQLDVDSPGEESYVRFGVSGVAGSVLSARLRMFVENGSSDGPSLYEAGGGWTESGITWNNRPPAIGGAVADIGVTPRDTWVEYDVTGHVTGDAVYDFVLKPDSSNGVRFSSRETSLPPELVLVVSGSSGNVAPVAVDDSASTGQGSPVIVNVAGNDGDVDGNLVPGSAAPTTGPSSGAAVGNANGTITYTPTPGFVGTDDFDYEICDTTALCDTATVTITVSSTNSAPVAVDDSASTGQGSPVIVNVAGNDGDVDGNLVPGSAAPTTGPSSGAAVGNANGTITYTPTPGFVGTDDFDYEICDTTALCDTATVTVTVGTSGPVHYVSFTQNATVPGISGTVRDEDVAAYDVATDSWHMFFDASDVGIGTSDLDAFHVRDDGSMLMSFSSDGLAIPGLTGGPSGLLIDDSDVILFTPTSVGATTTGSFSFYFDGSDVDLTSSGEDIDGLYEFDDGSLGISTSGSITMTGLAKGSDEDVHRFSGSFGSSTSGAWSLHFDGSDVGFTAPDADLNAVSFDADVDLLFSTTGTYAAAGGSGDDEDISTFTGTYGDSTSGTATLTLDLSTVGISPTFIVDALHLGVAFTPGPD